MAHRAPIIIEAYSSQWPELFASEYERLRPFFVQGMQLEHIGSTSVAGLAAKPIIDLMLGADDLAEIEQFIPTLEGLGYQYMPEHEGQIPQRRFFASPKQRPRLFHLHAVQRFGNIWHAQLAFRDALRADPAKAQAYAALKRQLAARYGDDRDAYAQAKSAFINSILRS